MVPISRGHSGTPWQHCSSAEQWPNSFFFRLLRCRVNRRKLIVMLSQCNRLPGYLHSKSSAGSALPDASGLEHKLSRHVDSQHDDTTVAAVSEAGRAQSRGRCFVAGSYLFRTALTVQPVHRRCSRTSCCSSFQQLLTFASRAQLRVFSISSCPNLRRGCSARLAGFHWACQP